MITIDTRLIGLAFHTHQNIRRLKTSKAQTNALRRHIEVADVFIGIVPDAQGGHIVLIKGKLLLQQIVADGKTRKLLKGAITVSCDEEALAMREVFGDGPCDVPQTVH